MFIAYTRTHHARRQDHCGIKRDRGWINVGSIGIIAGSIGLGIDRDHGGIVRDHDGIVRDRGGIVAGSWRDRLGS